MLISRLSLGSLISVLCLAVSLSAVADWPQWRGPDRLGSVEGADWPDALNDQTLTELWRVELPPGYPGPIVHGDHVFSFESKDAKQEVVRAFNRKTGEQLWESGWEGSMRVPFFAKRNGDWVKSTPATDGKHVYAAGMLDDLVCLDAERGDIVWQVDFKERYDTQGPSFGQPCSPLLDGDALYIQAGMSVCKLNKKTGETIWRSLVDERQMMGGAFSSPVIAEVAGKRQLLAQTRGELCGVDLESGDVLWRQSIKAFRGMNILPPTVINETDVFTSSYGGGCYMLRVTRSDDGSFNVETLWQNKIEGYMSSPLLIGGHLYMHGRDKKFHCINMATGETAWTSDKKYGEYWSSVRSGNRILALGHEGTLRLIEASPDELKIVSEHKVSDQETWGHLAVVGDVLYIREQEGLKAIRWSKAKGLD
jgi:outer membrane protein assembly factor BamB